MLTLVWDILYIAANMLQRTQDLVCLSENGATENADVKMTDHQNHAA